MGLASFLGYLLDFIVIQWDINGIYPLVMTDSLLLKMAIETVHLPIRHGGSFQYPQRETFTIYPRAQDSPGVGLS